MTTNKLQPNQETNSTVAPNTTEEKMRVLANYLIDYVLEINQKAVGENLNINVKDCSLIMEHFNKHL